MKKITILITGGGAPGIAGTVYALKNESPPTSRSGYLLPTFCQVPSGTWLRRERNPSEAPSTGGAKGDNPEGQIFRIITTDIKADVVGRYLTDGFYKVPPPEHKDFVKQVLKIAKKEKIDVILPQTTRELTVFARHGKDFVKEGIAVVVSSYESIKQANDKFFLLEKAKKIGIPYPAYFLTNSQSSLKKALFALGFPAKKVVVKPRVSNGMRGLRIITKDSWNVERFLGLKPEGIEISLDNLLEILRDGIWPELLAMEYLPGDEYTVDIFRGKSGSVVIPRLRQTVRSGITFEAQVRLRKDIIEYSKKLAEELNLFYCFGFQFREDQKGVPKIIECNPRVQGTMAASTFAGFNIIYYSVMEALGKKVDVKKTVLKEKVNFVRYLGGVASYDSKVIGKV